jgi:hypothetical protein
MRRPMPSERPVHVDMDTAGICMWFDVQLGPYLAEKTKRCLLVWDNCGPHKVAAVRDVMTEWGIRAEELPPKMTDILQVMDLLVNGPIKAGIRRARVDALFGFLQNWKIQRLQHAAKKDGTLPPEFKPPKPTQAQGLLCLFSVVKESLMTPKFKQSMKECFYHVGLAPDPDGKFAVYSPTKKGVLARVIPQCATTEDAVSVGEIVSEVALTSRSQIHVLPPVVGEGDAPVSGGAGSSSATPQAVDLSEDELSADESDALTSDEEEGSDGEGM